MYEARQYGIAALVLIAVGWFAYVLYKDGQNERKEKDAQILNQSQQVLIAFVANTTATVEQTKVQQETAKAIEALRQELHRKEYQRYETNTD